MQTLGSRKMVNMNVQYIGFEVKELVRQYNFVLRRELNQTSQFTLTIELQSFRMGYVRFQDAAEICSLRLHRELLASANDPSETHYHISQTELSEYQNSHPSKVGLLPHRDPIPGRPSKGGDRATCTKTQRQPVGCDSFRLFFRPSGGP